MDLFAPSHLYGTPDEFRHFIDVAHEAGIGVILDVVYNHFGPDGNYLSDFSPHYFSDRYKNEWGEALNFDERAHRLRSGILLIERGILGSRVSLGWVAIGCDATDI